MWEKETIKVGADYSRSVTDRTQQRRLLGQDEKLSHVKRGQSDGEEGNREARGQMCGKHTALPSGRFCKCVSSYLTLP